MCGLGNLAEGAGGDVENLGKVVDGDDREGPDTVPCWCYFACWLSLGTMYYVLCRVPLGECRLLPDLAYHDVNSGDDRVVQDRTWQRRH